MTPQAPTDKKSAVLTDAAIRAALRASESDGSESWLSGPAMRGEGRLLVRVRPGEARFYFRYSPAPGERDTLPLGVYGQDRPAITLRQATDRVTQLRARLRDPLTRDVRGLLESQAEAERRQREAQERERQSKAHTLKALLELYAAHLEKMGKARTAKDVRYAVAAHVEKAHPAIASLPARSVTRRDIAAIVRSVAEAGKLRRAGMLRSYLMAAYNLALRAESDPAASSELIAYNIEANPVAAVATVAAGTKARNRILSDDELRHFLLALEGHEGVARDIVKLGFLAGGQRLQQVARLQRSDVDTEGGFIRLLDSKGRRAKVREHFVPLAPRGKALAEKLAKAAKDAGSDLLFTSDGKTPVRIETIGAAVAAIAEGMKKREECASLFQARDLRRTAETRLAALGISKDLRAQLLSHGLSGIQAKHYDRHDYADEKRRALIAWEKHLADIAAGKTTGSGKVTSIKRKRA
jgi:hypothetical protein